MTDTKTPTPLDDLAKLVEWDHKNPASVRLYEFHSSPLGTALSDPAMRAALEVFASAFPGMLSLFEDRSEAASITFASLVENTLKTAFTEYHRALKAKETK